MKPLLANRYHIVKRLGVGGMADVYLAHDAFLNREVAIKTLRASMAMDPVSLLRFQREANASSQLNHPNIVEIYDVGEEDSDHYIVMEYIKGKTLKELIGQRGAMEKHEAISIMDQLVSAVKEAHDKNIIHRDIKPQNILVKDDGTVKITDFGIATVSDQLQLTQADTVMGSVHYLAPELARGESASFQSDIYALGITFYELLTGQVPHHGDQAVQVAMKHLKDDIPSVKEFNPSLPQSIENIIIKSTAKNKRLRYLNAQAFLDDLRSALSEKNRHIAKLVLSEEKSNDDTIMMDRVDVISNQKPKFFQTVFGMTILVVSSLLTIMLVAMSGMFESISPTVVVPDLTMMTLQEAEDALLDSGLSIGSIRYTLTDDIEAGLVVKTSPASNSELDRGSTLTLTLSEGKYIVLENYVGQNITDVQNSLSDSKITIKIERIAIADVATGTVVNQELLLPGSKLDPKRSYEMKLVVASPIEFLIPQLVGLNIASAQSQLESLGAMVTLVQLSTDGLTEQQKAKLNYGVVVSISPDPLTFYTQASDNSITLSYY
jgi:eukaryotic-like serine/threonine-protein kinase